MSAPPPTTKSFPRGNDFEEMFLEWDQYDRRSKEACNLVQLYPHLIDWSNDTHTVLVKRFRADMQDIANEIGSPGAKKKILSLTGKIQESSGVLGCLLEIVLKHLQASLPLECIDKTFELSKCIQNRMSVPDARKILCGPDGLLTIGLEYRQMAEMIALSQESYELELFQSPDNVGDWDDDAMYAAIQASLKQEEDANPGYQGNSADAGPAFPERVRTGSRLPRQLA